MKRGRYVLLLTNIVTVFTLPSLFVYAFTIVADKCRILRGHVMRLRFRRSGRYLWYRLGTSDADVIRQIFMKSEYEWLSSYPDFAPKTLLDCGANIGCVSLLFAERYPDARIVAVEPDPENFKILELNASQYGDAITSIHAGIWLRDCPLKILKGQFGDGLEWSFQVQESGKETAEFTGMTIDTILKHMDINRIGLLKIDIEDAEKYIFNDRSSSWLSRTDNLAIELHSPASQSAFIKALGRFASEFSFRAGELLVLLGLHSVCDQTGSLSLNSGKFHLARRS